MARVSLLVAAFACTAALVAATNPNHALEMMKIVESVNNAKTSWVAQFNPLFAQDSKNIRRLLGSNHRYTPRKFKLNKAPAVIAESIPASFDSRLAWPECPTIQEVRDQSICGSCWAFGAVEAASDRVCIATKGAKKPHISAVDLLSCCDSCGDGCNGGYPNAAWDYLSNTGLVTGGNFGDNTLCRAYPLFNCDHHCTGQYQPCPQEDAPTPQCTRSCDSNSTYTVPYNQDVIKFASSYSVDSSVAAIQTEIMTYGPVEAAFDVYADFEAYKSGVYRHISGDYLGGHAIKIIGWGEENNVPYWLIANSWNSDWGEKGFFRILRGSDHCGIESQIVAGRYN